MWRNHVIALLNDFYDRAKRKNPRYSKRSFAQKLDLSAGALSEILSGKRKLSAQRALRILKRIGVKDSELESLTVLMGLQKNLRSAPLRPDLYEFLGSWRHWATLSLVGLDSRPDAQEIAKRLNLTTAAAEAAIEDLERAGLLCRGPDGLTRLDEHLTTSDGPSDERLRTHHLSSLELTMNALQNIPSPRRDSTSITFTATPQQFRIIRDEIRLLHEKIAALSAAVPKEQSYHLTINLFPLDFREDS